MSTQTGKKTTKENSTARAEVPSLEQPRQPDFAGPNEDILNLQQTVGNRALNGLLSSLPNTDLDEEQSLKPDVQREMEQHFKDDFSKVRIHAGPKAEEKTRTEDATALTEGKNIYFGVDQYQPATNRGKKILTHELAHVIQQQPWNNGERIKSVNELETEAELATDINGHSGPIPSITPGSASPGSAQKITADEKLRRRRQEFSPEVSLELQQNVEERRNPIETTGKENIPGDLAKPVQGVSKDLYKKYAERVDKRETFEEFMDRGGVQKNIPQGVSQEIYKAYLERPDKRETLEKFIESLEKKKKDIPIDRRNIAKILKEERKKEKPTTNDRRYTTKEGRKAGMDSLFADEGIKDAEDPTSPGIKIHSFGGKEGQGRQERQGALRLRAFDPTVNRKEEDRKYLEKQLERFYPEMENGTYDEDIHRLKNPPGKVMAHEVGKEASKGYDLEHSRMETSEVNKAEERERLRNEKVNKGSPNKKETVVIKPPMIRKPANTNVTLSNPPTKPVVPKTIVKPGSVTPKSQTPPAAPETKTPPPVARPPSKAKPITSPPVKPNVTPAPTTPKSGGSGPAASKGPKAHTGEPDMTPVTEGGPSPRGEAKVQGAKLIFQGLNILLQYIHDAIEAQKIQEALAKRESEILKRRQETGVLVIVHYRRWESSSIHADSPIEAVNEFTGLELVFGMTIDEAHAFRAKQRWVGPPPDRDVSFPYEEIWLPPEKPPTVADLQLPLPIVGIGTFSDKPEMRDASWQGYPQPHYFFDYGKIPLQVPEGITPRFYILRPPEKFWGKEITVVEHSASTGENLPAVELEGLPFTKPTAAVFVFPADDVTAKVFIPGWRGLYSSLPDEFANMSMVRWIEPNRIRIINPKKPSSQH